MEQVKEQTQAVMAQFLKDNPEAGKGKVLNLDPYDGPGKNGYHPTRNPNAVGAKIDGLFPDLASYMQAVWPKGNPKADVQAKIQPIRDYQESVGAEGGFLVPEEFRCELAKVSLGTSILQIARAHV